MRNVTKTPILESLLRLLLGVEINLVLPLHRRGRDLNGFILPLHGDRSVL